MNGLSPRVRQRRMSLLRDLYRGPATRAELDTRHPAASTDLYYLRGLGLITVTDHEHPDPPLWAFRGDP